MSNVKVNSLSQKRTQWENKVMKTISFRKNGRIFTQ